MMYEQQTLEERFRFVIKDSKSFTTLRFPGHCVSHNPVCSKEYLDCNAVVIFNGHLCGVSHYNLKGIQPYYYLDKLLENLNGTSTKGLSAVVMGGDPLHFELITKILGDREIPIIGNHGDGCMEEMISSGLIDVSAMKKDLVAIPSTKEVIMYSQHSGYKQLAP